MEDRAGEVVAVRRGALAAIFLAVVVCPAVLSAQESPTINLGESVEKRPILAYRLGTGTCTVLILGSIHGDEPQGRDIVARLRKDIAAMPDLQAGRRLILVPAPNPDGLARRRRLNANRVDINRNFPTKDWSVRCEPEGCHPGPMASSEPETRILVKLISDHTPRLIIAIHSSKRVVNFDGPAETLAAGISKRNKYPVSADIGYATPGSLGTFAGKEMGIPTITLETSPRTGGAVYRENRGALLWAVAQAR